MVMTGSAFISSEGDLLGRVSECTGWLFVPVEGLGLMRPKGFRVLKGVLLHRILGVLHCEMSLSLHAHIITHVIVQIRVV